MWWIVKVMASGFMVFVTVSGITGVRESQAAEAVSHESGKNGSFRLGAGDVLNVFVWKNKEMSAIVTVRPDGMITYPLVGEIDVNGLTINEVEERLNKQLKRQIQDPQVTVLLQATHSFRVYVLGEVLQPGVFELKGPVTIVQALAMARGLTTFASKSKIFVVPAGKSGPRVPFNYDRYVQGEDVEQNVVLRPGDTVIVP
ncbi:MAG: polysaccharide biosynthesis/export family protein [Nitrospira sp.]|nr:polysaccharide biosynthesis/export family protein [Nitrospira sp.]